MVARKKKQKLGEVDLNQARLDEQENARPKVAPTQKINTPKEKKEPKETSAEKQMPTINEKNRIQNFFQTRINRFNSLNSSIKISSMTNHITIGKIQNNNIIFQRFHSFNNFFSNQSTYEI